MKIIDTILASSDLNTISEKRIRKGLQQALDHDITPQKVAFLGPLANSCCKTRSCSNQELIRPLIMSRFDKFIADQNAPPQTNGHVSDVKQEPSGSPEPTRSQTSPLPTQVHKRESTEVEESSETADVAKPKKKRKRSPVDDDALFAAKLQAEENIRARPTRGGGPKKATPVKRKKTPKKKTADRVDAADDSEMDSEAADKKVNRTGGFHVGCSLRTFIDG